MNPSPPDCTSSSICAESRIPSESQMVVSADLNSLIPPPIFIRRDYGRSLLGDIDDHGGSAGRIWANFGNAIRIASTNTPILTAIKTPLRCSIIIPTRSLVNCLRFPSPGPLVVLKTGPPLIPSGFGAVIRRPFPSLTLRSKKSTMMWEAGEREMSESRDRLCFRYAAKSIECAV